MLKVVLDTNQFVSSVIIKKGPPAQLLQAWRKRAYILIISRQIMAEVEKALHYPRILKKYHLLEKDIEALIDIIEHEAIVTPSLHKVNVIKEDPDDNQILACALEGKAQYIVSGDKHLLKIGQYKNIAIVTVREFLKIIGFPLTKGSSVP